MYGSKERIIEAVKLSQRTLRNYIRQIKEGIPKMDKFEAVHERFVIKRLLSRYRSENKLIKNLQEKNG